MSNEKLTALTHVPDNENVNRAIKRSHFDENDSPLVDAYLLRREKNETGLSVDISSLCTTQDSSKRLQRQAAVAQLNVKKIRDLNLPNIENILDVEHKPLDENQAHAEIIGLANSKLSEEHIEFLATKLRDLSEITWKKS